MTTALFRFFRPIAQRLTLDPRRIVPLVQLQWGATPHPLAPWWRRSRWTNLQIYFGRERDASLYWNGALYVRVMLPFYIGGMVRWSGSQTKLAFLQAHVGWKLNGEPAVTCRVQSDASAVISEQGPAFNNYGQAVGWQDGPK